MQARVSPLEGPDAGTTARQLARIQPALPLVVLAVLAWPSPAPCATPPPPKELFLSATASFTKGDYRAAEREFLACRQAVGGSPCLDFNLALTYTRLEELGWARLYLERARLLAPRDRAVREQLDRLDARLDQPAPPSPSWLHALWEGAKGACAYPVHLTLATIAVCLTSLSAGLWLVTRRRRWGWAGAAAGLAMALTWPPAIARTVDRLAGRHAIVVAETASVRGGPGEEFGEIAALSEGAEVVLPAPARLCLGPGLSVRLTYDDGGLWCEVRALSGARGYIRRSLIEPI